MYKEALVEFEASQNVVPNRFRTLAGAARAARESVGGSLHYCVGAPLARIEGEVALVTLARRLLDPRLVESVPHYRPGASLRGPRHLPIAIDGIID